MPNFPMPSPIGSVGVSRSFRTRSGEVVEFHEVEIFHLNAVKIVPQSTLLSLGDEDREGLREVYALRGLTLIA